MHNIPRLQSLVFVDGHTGPVRPIWRILLFLVIYVLSFVLLGAGIAVGFSEATAMVAAFTVITILTLLIVTVSARRFGGRSLSELGVTTTSVRMREFIGGVVLGSATLSATALISYGLGSLSTTSAGLVLQDVSLFWFTAIFIGFVCVSLYEEIIFRGVFIQSGIDGLASRGWSIQHAILGAMLASTTVFAFHNGVALWAVLYSAAFGFLLASAFVLSGGLAMPIGIHLAANIFMILIFGLGSIRVDAQVVLLDLEVATTGITAPMHGPLVVVVLCSCVALIGWYYRSNSVRDSLDLGCGRTTQNAHMEYE